MTDAVVVLHQFRPAYAIVTYLRAAGIPHVIVNSHYPSYASTGELPQIRHGRVIVGGTRNCLVYLKQVGIYVHCLPLPHTHAHSPQVHRLQLRDIDAAFSEEQRADAAAYSALILDVLANTETWVRWVDPIQYNEIEWPLVSRMIPAPLRWVLPRALQRQHSARLSESCWDSGGVLRAAALAAYSVLATKLSTAGRLDDSVSTAATTLWSGGSGPFLLSTTRPSSADVLLFGHLAAVRHALPGQWVLQHAPALLRQYEATWNLLYGEGAKAVDALLLRTSGCANLFSAFDTAVDARRLRNATTAHSRHAFARTSNSESLLHAHSGDDLGRSLDASTALNSSGWWPWTTARRQDELSSPVLHAPGASATEVPARPAEDHFSVARWGFGADRRLRERALATVRKSVDSVALNVILAVGLGALAIVALQAAGSGPAR
jgi:hypothetical protein